MQTTTQFSRIVYERNCAGGNSYIAHFINGRAKATSEIFIANLEDADAFCKGMYEKFNVEISVQ